MVKRGDGEVETDERNIVKENTTKRSWMYIESAEWKRWGNGIETHVILEGRAGSLHKERQFMNFYLDIWSLKQGWKREVKAPEQGSPSTGPLTVFWKVRAVATVCMVAPDCASVFQGVPEPSTLPGTWHTLSTCILDGWSEKETERSRPENDFQIYHLKLDVGTHGQDINLSLSVSSSVKCIRHITG